ncbi:MAG: TIM-barrel domain-containing protein [Spirochaetia bacterium]
MNQFKIDTAPKAHQDAVVKAEHVRFTVLTSRLIRIEYSPENRFEDRASEVFWYRKQPVPSFTVDRSEQTLVIRTDHLKITYTGRGASFSQYNLGVTLIEDDVTWKYGELSWMHNLKGTARTLDNIDGDAVTLGEGLMSTRGWSVIDDSGSVVFLPDGWITRRFDPVETQLAENTKDLYFFGYGKDYKNCLRDFYRVSGAVPMVPRYVLGNWWSRYWEYTEETMMELIESFEEHDIPLTVFIMDMDWHIVENKYTNGWTGYSWNRKLFPDPKRLMKRIHTKGLRTALNLHPADGVHPHEEMYTEMAEHLGNPVSRGEGIPFDMTDTDYVSAYFTFLHHPHEKIGVDFWWMDWQQGTETGMPGLDPLMWLNHLHYLDLKRSEDKRGLVFSRYGGLGSHRYPVGFSGDTIVSWKSLAFQPYFTATSANVGYGWWSHDIGGHMIGTGDRELYIRWVQFGVFSPVMRVHSSKNRYNERLPWAYDCRTYRILKEYMQLRHSLIPYLYTMMRRNHKDGLPLCLPMYYEHPEFDQAYSVPGQYYFGPNIICAPFTSPGDTDLRLSRQQVWLPPGRWFNFFNGEFYPGGKRYGIYGDLEDMPVFASEGAVIPMEPKSAVRAAGNPLELDILIFPGKDGSFDLYEDDGISQKYQSGEFALTPFRVTWQDDFLRVIIGPAEGRVRCIPKYRTYNIVFRGFLEPKNHIVMLDGRELCVAGSYNSSAKEYVLTIPEVISEQKLELFLYADGNGLIQNKIDIFNRCRKLLFAMNVRDVVKRDIDSALEREISPAVLKDMTRFLSPSQVRALTETIQNTDWENILA